MDKHVKFGGEKKQDIRARAGPFIFFTERLTRASIAFGYSDTLCRLYSMSPGLIVTTFGLGSLLSDTVVACTRAPRVATAFPLSLDRVCRWSLSSPLFLSLPPAAGSCGRCQKAYGGWQRGWWITVKVDELIDVQERVIVVP